MPRNLDLTALRSFTAVADAGGVTRAAAQLNLTQSAVSMQLKRLEEALGLPLLDRSARTIALTAQGEQLLGYARRLLALNDEAWGRLTHPAFEGDDRLRRAARHHLPARAEGAAALRGRVSAGQAAAALALHQRAEGALRPRRDGPDPDHRGRHRPRRRDAGARAAGLGRGARRPGLARRGRCASPPARNCVFKRPALEALDAAGIPWESRSNSISPAAVDASVAADLAVSVQMAERACRRAARRSATAGRCPSCPTTRSTCTWPPGRARRSPAGSRRCCARPTAWRTRSRRNRPSSAAP